MMRSSHLLPFALCCCFLLSTCTPDDTAARRRADVVFARAKEALARGDHLVSRAALQELLPLETALGRTSRRAETALLLANNYLAGAEFDSAFMLCGDARMLYHDLADRNGVRAAVIAQADAHRLCGEDAKAYALLAEELGIEQALGLKEGARELREKLIPVAHSLGHADVERRLLEELFADALRTTDSTALVRLALTAGTMFTQRSLFDSALAQYQRAALLAQRARAPLLAIEALMQCGILADRLQKVNDAYRFFSDALRAADSVAGADQLRAELLLRSANIYLRQERRVGARKFLNVALRTAIKSGNRLLETYALLQLGHAYAGNPTEGRKRYEAGAALASLIGAPHVNAYAQWCLGDFAARLHSYDAALEHLRAAVASEDSALATRDDDMLSDCETTSFGGRSPYDALLELLLTLGKYDEAFAYAERRNRREMFRALSGSEITTQDTALNASLHAFFVARRNYIGAERQLSLVSSYNSESRALLTNVQRSLALHSARLRDVGDSIAAFNKHLQAALLVEPATLSDVQAVLPVDATLLQFVPTTRALYALVVTKKQLIVELAAIERAVLTTTMNDYLDALQQRAVDIAPTDAAALERRVMLRSSQLYDVFIRPIESRLRDAKKLFVILPSNLPLIPLHSLKRSGKSSPYAIERWEFRYLSDAGMLELKPTANNKPTALAGFANHGRSSVDVVYEVHGVRAFAKNMHMSLNTGADAMAGLTGDVLYVAADIQHNIERPDNSFLALAKGTARIAYEHLGTLFSLGAFPTVVISVLNNQPRHASLPRIMRMNGAADVVTNLYLPMRKAKAMFNEVFFTSVMSGKPAERAYRTALLEMLKNQEYKTPHIWAAFSLF
jgi:CHAT domain-containing protein